MPKKNQQKKLIENVLAISAKARKEKENIEINMRYTMGMVALRLSQRYLAPHAIGDFHITYDSKVGEAYERHRFMKGAYPLTIENGKIREGYLSLCPVTKETKYRAYILVV